MTSPFYVHIVESPAPSDLLDGRTEGRSLCAYLDAAEIPYVYNLAVDPEQFRVAMTTRLVTGYNLHNVPPILHLSAHGNEHGVQLCRQREDGALIQWHELAEYVRPVHQHIGGLGICVSSCGGAHGERMAHVILEHEVPFAWLVGSAGNVNWADAALAFSILYRRLHQDGPFTEELFTAIRVAARVPDFGLVRGEETHRSYRAQLYLNFQEWLRTLPRPDENAGGPQFPAS